MAGKGSKRRPSSISREKLADNWELAFGKKPDADNNKITTSIEVIDTVIFNSQGSHATINTPENKNSLDSDN